MKRSLLFILILLVFSGSLYSQVTTEVDTDKIYIEALEAYKNNNFERAVALTRTGLEIAPKYHDIRILKIRSLWASKLFEEADEELDYLLETAPDYPDVLPLVHQRLNRYESDKEKLSFIEKTEPKLPEDFALQARKADLLIKNNRKPEGRKLARALFSRPGITGADKYTLQLILARSTSDEIGVGYQYVGFSDDYSREESWKNITAEYLHNFGRTSFIGRVNYTDRGYEQGMLYEIEAYPVFSNNFYAYTNVGVSNGNIFPDVRSSISLYYNFLKIFEAEAGGRLQNYKENSFLTGVAGLSMYRGDFLFNIRTFLGPHRLGQLNQNYQGNIRYYLRTVDNFLFLRLGSGLSPDERLLSIQELVDPRLEASYGMAGINFSLGIHHLFQVSAGILYEDIRENVRGHQYLGNLNYRYRF